jgi:hypothetical protein
LESALRKFTALLTIQCLCCGVVFASNPRWQVFGTPIPARPDLTLHWEVPANRWPTSVSVYRLLPNKFSPEVISNVMALYDFTAKDIKTQSSAGVTCQSSNDSRNLSISFSSGAIHYSVPDRRFGPTNLAVGVPTIVEMHVIATNVLQKLGINLDDLRGYYDASKFSIDGPETWYYVSNTILTNFAYRTISFRRSVDGIAISGGDGGSFDVGEHHKICKMAVSWRKLESASSFPTYSPEIVTRLFREGKAMQGLVPSNITGINWKTVRSIVITGAMPCYCSGKSDYLYPFLALTASVETEEGRVNIEIDTPIIDESQKIF